MAAPDFTAHRRAMRARALAATSAGWIALTALAGCIPTAPNLAPGAESLPCTGPGCVPLNGGAAVTTAPTVDCESAQQGLDFAPFTVLDNENANLLLPGVAEYFYQYVDGTAGLTPSGYSPPAILADRCTDNPPSAPHPPGSNYVLHTSGGPFTGWGGGIGIALAHINTDSAFCTDASSPVCPAAGGSTTTTPCYCPPVTSPNPADLGQREISHAAMDVSQWDGISLWARRGPNSQPLLRVLVGDKYTDDDISYLMYVANPNTPPSQRYCERKADCGCNFQDTFCSFYSSSPTTDPQYASVVITTDKNFPDPGDATRSGALYCGAPESHPGSASQNLFSNNGLKCDDLSGNCADNFCGESVCDAPYSAYAGDGPDLQFENKPCTTYTYRNGTQSDVCYDPAHDLPPPEGDEQCGDHFTFPINLSTEWQFYKIPFAEMFQQGWAKQAPTFDLKSVSVVRFTWDVGYIDYYIDDVRFYRAARSADAATP
jgi:hypothetical protein